MSKDENDMEELKSCPFCGGNPQITSDGGCKEFKVFCVAYV